jgi:hypothetical protein
MKVMHTEKLSYNSCILLAGWHSGNVIDAYLIAAWFESRPGHVCLERRPRSSVPLDEHRGSASARPRPS